MKAADVMVTNVITVTPDQSVQEVAEILLTKRISGLPVVDADGKLVGIVSEGDLMRRVETGTARERSWWLRLLMGREGLAQEYIRQNANRVGDVMTRSVITAEPDTPLPEVAGLLERNRIKRVPIVKDGKLVGILSRANLLQALASLRKEITIEKPAADTDVRARVMESLNAEPWGQNALLNVTVRDGTVDLWGIVDTPAEKRALRIAAEKTPGVREVNDNVVIRPMSSEM